MSKDNVCIPYGTTPVCPSVRVTSTGNTDSYLFQEIMFETYGSVNIYLGVDRSEFRVLFWPQCYNTMWDLIPSLYTSLLVLTGGGVSKDYKLSNKIYLSGLVKGYSIVSELTAP